MATENEKKKFVPNREAELAQSKRTAQAKQKAEENVQKWTNRTGSTENLIKQYGATSSNYKRIYKEKKWYSGKTPTLRETYARMYDVAGDDNEKWRSLVQMFNEETSNRGSAIYNPYAQVTNSKAVDGLRQLGVEVPDKITDEWVDGMWREFGQYARETTTGYGPGAPTKSSTVQNDIAYWVNTLLEDKENTNLAEAQMQGMYNEVEYLAKQGYSDKEILKRVKANKDYKMLWAMDEARLAGDAIRLNRAVNYSGDDTIYGMIWAARNPEDTQGDYFIDSVKYTMGLGNKYKADPNSEAALDPSNYEGFDPYARGGTLHSMNMKYGTTEFNREWLDANRSMLNDPEQADDWRAIEKGVENSEAAAKEKEALDQWMAKKVESGISAEDLEDQLTALLSGDGKVTYTDPDGKRESITLKTLAKMEDERASGTYLDMGYGVDVTLPNYIAQGLAMIEERDAAAQAEAEAKSEEKGFFEKAGDTLASVSRNVWNWITGDRGALEDVVDAQKGDTVYSMSIEDTAKKYAKDMFGVDITGEIPKHVEAALKDAIGKANKANMPGASKEDIEAANTAAGVLQDMFNEVIADPKYRASEDAPAEAMAEPEAQADYTTRESWTSVANPKQEEPREGMVEMIPETTAFKGEAAEPENEREAMLGAYADMCQGGEWNFDTFGWAIQNSSNPSAIRYEIGQAIIDHKTTGAELTGLARSWWDKFGGLVDNTGGPTDYSQINEYEAHPERFDSRMAYGTQIYDLLQANEQALKVKGAEEYGSTYARNLMSISEIADGISRSTGGERATDEQAAEYMQQSGAQMVFDEVSNRVSAVLEEDARKRGEERRMQEIANAGVINRAINGEMTDDDTGAFFAIMTADVSGAAANDTTYQAASAYIHDALGFDSIAESGMNFSTGDKRIDATYDKMELLNTGAAIYSKGVTALAQAELDTHMRYAAACGMTLEQFYEKYPQYARTPEQIAAEARAEYSGVWKNFEHTIDGLLAANESILNAGDKVEGGEQRKDELDFSDTLALAVDKLMGTNALNWEKTMYMLQHAWKSEADEQSILRTQYSNDRTKYAADVDKLISDKEAELQKIYENDITAKQSGMSYDDWRIENSDPLLDEIKAKRETATDIFEIGDLEKLKAEQVIAEKTGNIANIDKLVSEYGSEFDQMVYNGTTSLMQTGQFMYMSTVLGGGYAASLISTLTGSGGDAYDRFMQSGDYDAAVAGSIGAWLVNAAIEKMSFDRFMPEYAGGAQGQKMLAVQSMLQREGAYVLLKEPRKLAKAAGAVMETLAKAGFDAAGEGLEEGLQSIVDSIADNIIYGNEYILSAEQMNEAIREGVAGMAMAPIISVGSTSLFGRPKITDRYGQAISKAEAQLLPEHDGILLNDAIDFEATAMAITNSGESLAAIENSSENAAKKQAEQELQAIEAELQEKETKLAEIQAEHDTAIVALEDVNVEMQDSDAFTEDMGKRMTAAATTVNQTQQQLNDAKADVAETQGRKDSAQKHLDDATAKVQQMYDQTMDEAKAKYAKEITDKYYAGDSDAQREAGEAYQQACRNLEDAKTAEANARAAKESADAGSDAGKVHGQTLLAVDAAVEEVENAKAAMDAAYAETAEGKAEAAEDVELATAEAAAVKAAEEAAADPMNSRKQLAADTEQARLNAIRANHDMKRSRTGISQRLKSPDSKMREQAVTDWKALQQQASDAAAEAQELETLFNETDTQKNLQNAIDEFKQYNNEQLLFDSEEGHAQALTAYNKLQLLTREAEVENRRKELDAAKAGTPEYETALRAYNDAVIAQEDEIARQLGVTGDTVREVLKRSSLGTQVLDAVQRGDQKQTAKFIKQILDADTQGQRENLLGQLMKQRRPFQLLADAETGATGKAGVTKAYSRQAGKNLSKDSKLQLDVLGELAKETGFEIVVKDSLSNVEGAVNGVLGKGGTIYIGLDAIEHGYLQVGTHEIVHGIKQRDDAAYTELQQTVTDILKEQGLDIDQMVKDRIEKYGNMGQTIDEAGALEEIVAESTAQIWGSEENMRKFAEAHPSAFKQMYDGFMQFWSRVRDIANRIARKNGYEESKTLLADDGALQKIYDTFMKVAQDSGVGGDVQEAPMYSLNIPFADQLDAVLDPDKTFPMNSHLYIMDTPPALIEAGLDSLPLLMTQKHARSVTKTSGSEDVHYHGLTKNIMKKLPELLSNNIGLVIKAPDYNNRVIAFVDMSDENHRDLLVPVEIDVSGTWLNARIDANMMLTAYSKDTKDWKTAIRTMLFDAVGRDEVLYADKKRSYKIAKNVGIELPKRLSETASKRSIRDFAPNVKKNTAENNKKSLNTSAWNQDAANDLAEQLMTNTGNAAQIADILGRMEGDMWRDHRAAGRTGENTTADRNPIEILSDLTRSIRVGYNPGGDMSMDGRRMPRAVQGFYNRHARSITTRGSRTGDLEIGLHEFGHAVQQRLNGLHANDRLLNGLSQGVRDAYDAPALDGEAIAEFVVDYIFSRDEAVRQAGADFVQEFEEMLQQDRPLYDAIMNASHQTELWNNADTGSKIEATTKDGNDPRRGEIGNWLQRTARNIETAVADMTAPADLVSRDFRQRALYSMHAGQRADVALSRFLIDPQGRNIGQSLAERFYRAGVTEADMTEVSNYALARHALDRRRQNRDVFDASEFPTADLEAYIADVEANSPNIVAGADALTSFWNDFMDAWWVGTGMIAQEDVDRMRQMYPHYVPTFRVVGKNFNHYGGRNSRFRIRGAVEGGSGLEVINPLNSIVRMTQQMVSTVTQNQLMRDFHNEMRQGALGFIADDVTETMRRQHTDTAALQTTLDAINATGVVDPALMDDAYAEMLNLQERWYGTGQNYGANVVSGVDEDGNRFFYRIKDEGLYNLLSGTANRSGDAGMIMRGIRTFKNTFTKLTTGSNPLFAIKNAMRDIQSSVNTGTHSLTYADGMVRFVGALIEIAQNTDTYQDWKAMGGGEHTRYSTENANRNAGSSSRELARQLMRGRENRRGEIVRRKTALERVTNFLTWESLNNAVENASRYMEYRYGRNNDLTTDEGRRDAFMRSQDVTTNFGTHGASGVVRVLNKVVPFMNATIQGVNKDINLLNDLVSGDANRARRAAPKLAKTVMNTALTAMLQYALLKAFGGSEDDEDYELLNQEMRTGNLIIKIPDVAMQVLGDQFGFDKPYIRVPMAQGPLAQAVYALSLDTVANVADYSPMEVDLWRAAKSIIGDAIPDGTVFQGILDARNNRTWYGGEIESEYMRRFSEMNRYDSDTPQAIVEIANALDVSPAKLDYLLNQYTGFAGKLLMPMISAGRLDGEYTLKNSGKNLIYSVFSNYTIDPISTNDLSANYNGAKTIIDEIIADGKAGKRMGNLGYSANAENAFIDAEYLSDEFAAIDKEISAAWNEYNAIKDSDMDDGTKSRKMREIRQNQIAPLQMDALALYEEYRMQYIDCDNLAIAIYGRIPGGLKRPILD